MDYTVKLREIGGEDSDTMNLLIDIFLEQAPELINHIKSSHKTNQLHEAKNHAHALKGVCMNLGIDDMAETCLKIEHQALSNDKTSVQDSILQLEQNFQSVSEQFISLKS